MRRKEVPHHRRFYGAVHPLRPAGAAAMIVWTYIKLLALAAWGKVTGRKVFPGQ